MTISFLRIPFIDLLRALLITINCLLFAGLATLASAATMEITVKNDLISVELVDVPLIEVLQRVKQEFGFKAHFHGDLSELITLSFTDFPLEKCLQQLTANHSLSVASLTTTKIPEQNDRKQIAEVWVISRSSISRNVNVPPVAPVLQSSDLINNTAKIKEEAPELTDAGERERVTLEQLLNDP
ncbi:MAG: hypothetical protein QNK24_08165, partial [Desulfuromusa sp.]|nr:hypothetical protein [Desulfuromusa sp.]